MHVDINVSVDGGDPRVVDVQCDCGHHNSVPLANIYPGSAFHCASCKEVNRFTEASDDMRRLAAAIDRVVPR